MPSAMPTDISLPDRYRPVRHLATGGMATVWEAHDELLDRRVAVKLLAGHLAGDARARERFEREARAVAGLSSHPYVVTIYDVGEHDGRAFMVMELMTGGSVAGRLRAGRVGTGRALRWLEQAAQALDAAHHAGIVHRDVKPGNLLLDARDRLAIADFGIARLAWEGQLTGTGEVLGTGAYLAPEQAVGESADPASDRYAFAVVAYQLLTGTRPFEADHFAAQARAHVEDDAPPASTRAPELPAAVDAVLARGLDKDPGRRWPTATAGVADLRAALDDGGDSTATAATRVVAPTPAPRGSDAATEPGGRGAAPNRRATASATDAGGRGVATGTRRGAPSRTALLALAAVTLAAVATAIALRSGGDDGDRSGGSAAAPTATATASATATDTATAEPTPTATASAEPTPTPTATATATASAAPSATPGSAAALAAARKLQVQGFGARRGGDDAQGLALAQQALALCGDTKALDPCGYALYEVGVGLTATARPAEAIPFLQRRLAEYGPNADTQRALRRAQRAAG